MVRLSNAPFIRDCRSKAGVRGELATPIRSRDKTNPVLQVKVHLRCLSWPVRGLLFILLFISAQRAAALTQRIELYRDNALLDTNPLRRLDNVMV